MLLYLLNHLLHSSLILPYSNHSSRQVFLALTAHCLKEVISNFVLGQERVQISSMKVVFVKIESHELIMIIACEDYRFVNGGLVLVGTLCDFGVKHKCAKGLILL